MKTKNTMKEKIIEYLRSQKTPVSATDLVEKFNQKNKTTIYRQLDKLEKGRVINSMVSAVRSKTLYEINKSHVAHFECQRCGEFLCVEGFDVPQIANGVVTQIQLEGTCLECAKS